MKVWVCVNTWCDDVTVKKVVDSEEKAIAWKSKTDAEISRESLGYESNDFETYEVE